MRSGSYPRQQTPLPEPSRSMWRAISTLLPIVLALILLPAIAFASPPDPSWVAGIYDGADGDDIVSLVYENSATNAAPQSHIGKLPCLPGIPIERINRRLRSSRFAQAPRAPPAIRSTVSAHVFVFLACYAATASPTKPPLPAYQSQSPDFCPEDRAEFSRRYCGHVIAPASPTSAGSESVCHALSDPYRNRTASL